MPAGWRRRSVWLRELELDVLCEDAIAANPADRCYFCKRRIFGAICTAAAADGYPVVLDGTNASDDRGDRPGMRALEQAHVLSPLRLCGLTKAEVRRRSKAAGLFTWDKPAYACLATRVPTGELITAEKLRAVERSEAYLFALGFTDLRVRLRDGGARCCSFRRRSTRRHGHCGRRSPQGCPNTFPPSN